MLMVMGSTVCFFPTTFITLLPSSSSPSVLLLHSTTPHFHFHLRASSSSSSATSNNTKTTRRRSRRLKSDAEICHDIRQFLASVGLPDHHVPSTKELLLHGRNDLANIVRRRGHKQIEELLTSSLNANIGSLLTENSFGERLEAADDCEGLLTGQNVKVDSLVDDVMASAEVCLGSNSSSLETDSTVSLDECTSISVESSANLMVDSDLDEPKDHAEEVNHVLEENCSSSREGFYANFDNQHSMPTEISGEPPFGTKYSGNLECDDNLAGKMVGDITSPSQVPSMEKDYNFSFNDSALETEHKGLGPLASSTMDLSLEQKDWCALEGLDDSNNNISENVTSTSEASTMENLSGENKGDSTAHADSSSINPDPLASLSLEEKVANFIQNGDLDPVEVSDGDDSQESKVNLESEPVADMPLGTCPPSDNNAMALNGSSLTSNHHVPSGTMGQLLKDDHMRHIDQTTNFNTNLDAEVPKEQNQSEINYLKFMLYQKELELSRLKEQIEKEKLSLSVLQTKAEAEINKARKLISEKDAELHVAEESLSGLKEVQVEFCGDGDVVEVAGSFNGWHHRIKMDPQPSTSAIDFGGSRRSRFWSTTLWLYPGVYERAFGHCFILCQTHNEGGKLEGPLHFFGIVSKIKFVVDGHWRLDSQRESVTRGHICNNILRVDR